MLLQVSFTSGICLGIDNTPNPPLEKKKKKKKKRFLSSETTKNEPRHDKTNKMSVRPAKTDQPEHPPSLIRVLKKLWALTTH